MRAPRLLLSSIALPLLLGLGACGGEPVDPPVGVTDAEYFGLSLGSCTELRGGLGGAESMTVGVEVEDEALGFTTKKVRYRLGGLVRRTDFVTAENGRLLLHRREVIDPVAGDRQADFDPPILWMERPIVPTGVSPLVTETQATDGLGATETWNVKVTVNQLGTEETADGPIEAYPVYTVIETGTARRQDRAWVAPEVGFVRLDLDGEGWPDMTLHRQWVMGEGESTCVPPQS